MTQVHPWDLKVPYIYISDIYNRYPYIIPLFHVMCHLRYWPDHCHFEYFSKGTRVTDNILHLENHSFLYWNFSSSTSTEPYKNVDVQGVYILYCGSFVWTYETNWIIISPSRGENIMKSRPIWNTSSGLTFLVTYDECVTIISYHFIIVYYDNLPMISILREL